MKHIIANPHNGAPVEVNGTTLLPGHELEVKESDAVELKNRYEFLHQRTAAGVSAPAKAKVKKLKTHLEFSHITPPDTDPGPQMVVHGGKPKVAAKRVVKSKGKKAVKKAAK